ncbi:MAG: PaaI family thioesterase [Spirochaetaceae bacterium]
MDGERRFENLPDLAEEVLTSSSFESESPMKIPSPSFLTAGGKIIAYEGRKLLRSAFPVPEEYSNPAGFLQGGYITTLLDDTFGPLSYLAAGRPAVTLNLATTFIRPVPVSEEFLVVEAQVVSRGRRVLTMSGRVENSRGKLVATATSINQVME